MDNLQRSRRIRKKPKYFRRVKKKAEFFLPDEIIIDIISRLPAEDVVICRRVCRRWRDLTSAQDFLDSHTNPSSVPMVLVEDQYSYLKRFDRFLLKKWWEPEHKKSFVHWLSSGKYYTRFSQGGLIVSAEFLSPKTPQDFIVSNPMNGESVTITLSKEICSADIYGVFYHPSLKEYCTLWRITKNSSTMEMAPEYAEYKMLNLGSNPQWREISNPWTHKPRICSIPPVLIHKYIYWLLADKNNDTMKCHFQIMEFDIDRAQLTLMPNLSCSHHVRFKCFDCNVRLLNIDGLLSLVRILGSVKKIDIDIWTLKDRDKQFWTSSHYSIGKKLYRKEIGLRVRKLQPIAVVNEELVFHSTGRLFTYNLKWRTIRKVGKRQYGPDVSFFPHCFSFASLKNCSSLISI